MQKMKSHLLLRRYRYITALITIASVIAFVARPSLLASSAAEQGKRQKYDGEKIFRGLVFGEEGPIAEMFPQIWKNPQVLEQMKSEKRMKAWNDFKEVVVSELKNRDRTFFDRFGEAMQSGDHIKIVDGLNEAGAIVRQAIEGQQAAAKKRTSPNNSEKQSTTAGRPVMVKAAMSRPLDTTTCEYGICVTEDDYGVTVFEDAANPQDVTASACSAVAVCALALLVAVWKWAVVVDVAAVVYVAAAVVAVWKWKYTYNRTEISDAEYFFQDMLVDDIYQNLYYVQ